MELDLLLRFMPDLYLILDTDFNIVELSHACEKATMIKRENVLGHNVFDVFLDNPNDPTKKSMSAVKASFDRVLKYKVPERMIDFKYEIAQPTSQGGAFEERYWSTINVPILNDKGDVLYILIRIQDVTELVKLNRLTQLEQKQHKNKEAQLIDTIYERSKQLALLIDSMLDAYVASNEYSEIIGWNKQAEAMFGWTKAEILGKSLLDTIIPSRFKHRHLNGMHNYLTTGKGPVLNKRIEVAGLHKNGKEIPIEMSITHIEGGETQFFCAFMYDITRRKQAQEQLEQTLEELMRSNTELEQFAYIASHDLQEPLRMVVSFTQLLELRYKNALDEEAKKYIQYAVDAAKHMQVLLNDLLLYSRITTEKGTLKMENMESILQLVLNNLSVTIKEQKATITHDPLPVLYTSKVQMARLLQNLIVNGIKFHSKGKIPHIHISAILKNNSWLFSVRDNGMGIAGEYLEQIFIIFKRLHRKTDYEGTGIGLAVCKKIMERLGGSIWAESVVGKGTTVYFSLPNKDIIV